MVITKLNQWCPLKWMKSMITKSFTFDFNWMFFEQIYMLTWKIFAIPPWKFSKFHNMILFWPRSPYFENLKKKPVPSVDNNFKFSNVASFKPTNSLGTELLHRYSLRFLLKFFELYLVAPSQVLRNAEKKKFSDNLPFLLNFK